MALFSGNLRKMINELDNGSIDWSKVLNLSSGKYDLTGKNVNDARKLVKSLTKRAFDSSVDLQQLTLVLRNVISHGADFNRSINALGETPMHIAAGQKDSVFLSALLSSGVQPFATTHSGLTPLHSAVIANVENSVKMLIQAGADPGAEDANRNTPLHLCLKNKQPIEIVKILLDAGAKVYQRNAEQETILMVAEKEGQALCLELLRENLKTRRRNLHRDWFCPNCGEPLSRPPKRKVEWYISLDMWEDLRFTCGNCMQVFDPTVLDGE